MTNAVSLPSPLLLRMPAVIGQLSISRSTLYTRISEELFPPPIHLGPRAVAWPAGEVTAMASAWIQGLSDADLRRLVKKLIAARTGGRSRRTSR